MLRLFRRWLRWRLLLVSLLFVLLLFLLLVLLLLGGHRSLCIGGFAAEHGLEARSLVASVGWVGSLLLLHNTVFVWYVLLFTHFRVGSFFSSLLHLQVLVVVRLLFLFFFIVIWLVLWRVLTWQVLLVLQKWLLIFQINIFAILSRILSGHRYGFFSCWRLSLHLLHRHFGSFVGVILIVWKWSLC